MASDSITVGFPGGKRVDARIGDFLVSTDQGVKSGGEGSAPEPFDLFLASVATCAGVYALNFCHSRNLATDGLGVRMTCKHDDTKKLIAKMVIELSLPSGFPEKYRDSIVRAMERCAVKRHIVDAPDFEMRVSS